MTTLLEPEIEAQTPCGLNHLVLNVRDIEQAAPTRPRSAR